MVSNDIRLKENFKLFISGPSRCGKTFFVSNLIENIDSISREPPELIVYIYTVWQSKYEEISSIVHHFIKDGEEMCSKLEEIGVGRRVLLIFDDMMNSPYLPFIAKLFTVDGRHMNRSLVFLSQKLYKNDDYFRQISRNADYYCIFKSIRDISEIRTLAQQMTPGSLDLVGVYQKATRKPWSYLFIDLTQECDDKLRYRCELFQHDHYVRVIAISRELK